MSEEQHVHHYSHHARLHQRRNRWTATKVFLLCAVIFLAGAGIIYAVWGGSEDKPESVLVGKGTIIEEVTVTGRVQPVDDIRLSFEQSGKIKSVFVNIGSRVVPGQALAELDAQELSAKLYEAEAGIESARAKLQELERGARPEELRIREADLEKAEQDLENYYADTYTVLSDAYAKADDAVRSKTDALFANDDTTNAQLTFSSSDSQAQVDAIELRILSGAELLVWKGEVNIAAPTTVREALETLLASAEKHLVVARNFLSRAYDAVGKSFGVSAALVEEYKTNIAVGRTNVNTALANVVSRKQAIAGQKITVLKYERELELLRTGSAPEQVAEQSARVKQAEAQRDLIAAQIGKMTLRSPIEGLVTKQDATPGEIVSPQAPLISIISPGSLEIETNIPEVDIGRVMVGNPVVITLDAFPGEKFDGKVSYIEPAETIIDGVVNFKVTALFLKPDERFKSGLTANMNIETVRKTNVVVVPQFAVLEKDAGTFVRKIEGTGVFETPVQTGIRSRDGNVEVISGLREGDRVENVGMKSR